MPDYKEMDYYSLKNECKKQRLDSKGTKVELLARLGVGDTSKQPDSPEPDIEAKLPEPKAPIKIATQEELNKFLPDATGKAPIDTSKYNAWLTDARLEKLSGQIDPIAAGKGRYRYDIDRENGAFQIEFSGRALGLYSTTLIDTDQQIIKQAQYYFNARVSVGKNAQQSAI